MAIAKAKLRYLRMTSRKVNYILKPLRRRTVSEALAILSGANRRAAQPVAQLIRSALANARQEQPALREEDLIITKLSADVGPTWKRFRAAPFGRAAAIMKRTTHLNLELDRKK